VSNSGSCTEWYCAIGHHSERIEPASPTKSSYLHFLYSRRQSIFENSVGWHINIGMSHHGAFSQKKHIFSNVGHKICSAINNTSMIAAG
jgi:hypothetical protein